MRYYAKDLYFVYKILETLPKPLAVLDFMCGGVGDEIGAVQSFGGQFYDRWSQNARVVALCWEGASLLYANVSDDQIEFTDKAQSMLGNKEGKPWKRQYWLKEQGHTERLAAIAGTVARKGPFNASGQAMKRDYNIDTPQRWRMIKERLTRTGYVFSTGNPPLIQEPYIAIFDRNERFSPMRNTRHWQVKLFRRWAKDFGFKLVVISDFYPRRWWEDVIRFSFADRNFDRLCNIIRHSVLYAAPPSGSGCAGMVFGCNFVNLCEEPLWPMLFRDVIPGVFEGRGFRYFGTLTELNGEVADNVREYLAEEIK